LGRNVCRHCRGEASSLYRNLLAAIIEGQSDPIVAKARLLSLAAQAGLSEAKRRYLNLKAFEQFLTKVLAQRASLSEQDEATVRFNEIGNALDFDAPMLSHDAPDLVLKYTVALANAGRLSTIANVGVLLKKGEVAHLDVAARLLKDVQHTVRRYSGFSFRIVRGVYYHIGESHPIATNAIREIDVGSLTVTSNRVVYTGNRESLEIPYSKLLAVKVFTDAIEFNLSNRKNAALFRVANGFGHVVAATVNAAFQRQAHEQ
jgi:hypothetical protein